MSVTLVDSPLVYGAGQSDRVFDLGGAILRRGSGLGDKQIVQLQGMRNVLKRGWLDDLNYAGVNGVASVAGEGNEMREMTLDNLRRYGIITTGNANNFKIRVNTINTCQHGISGSSGSDGAAMNPCTNGLVEDNIIKVAGQLPRHGIKLKNWINVVVRRNDIDVSGAHTGIIFGAGDASNLDCIVEENNIHSATRSGYGVVANRDAVTSPTPSSGNIIRNNNLTNITRAILLRNAGYIYYGNILTNCGYDFLGDYTVTKSGSTMSARSPSESVIATGTDLGAILRAINKALEDANIANPLTLPGNKKSIYIHSGGVYNALTTATLTTNYITVIGVDASFSPPLSSVVASQGVGMILSGGSLLNYASVPSGIPATVDGVSLQSGKTLQAAQGSSVIIAAPMEAE